MGYALAYVSKEPYREKLDENRLGIPDDRAVAAAAKGSFNINEAFVSGSIASMPGNDNGGGEQGTSPIIARTAGQHPHFSRLMTPAPPSQ